MFLGLLTLITALSISAVAIYYSVAGLMTIFAAAAVPIMIMGGVLEVGKLVTAVWLHKYWKQATWWLKTYLTTAVVVLMFITSMGIFGYLSKAHIEQTSSANEGVAQLERIETEIARQNAVIGRAEQKIVQLENSSISADTGVQEQIDREQERINLAFERIQPAIQQQNQIIKDARDNDATRTKPYEEQLTNIQAEVLRLETSAREYETSITELSTDNSVVEPLLAQIAGLEDEIIRVTNQLNSGERQQIRAGQAIIGVTSDGAFGRNTRAALATWVSGQRERIAQIQSEVSQVRQNVQTTVDAERERLAGVVKDIRERQIPALKQRELAMLDKIDEVRQTESPAIATARNEIQRLRESAEAQVAQSQILIERLRGQLAQTDKAEEIDLQVDEQTNRIREANTAIDTLTEQRYTLEAEYRKLEAEVGPVKYIAEFIYGETADTNLLEEAVRWVILIIIFVFDPLAVLLLIASQYTFELNRKRKEDDQKELLRREWEERERQRAQRIVDNPGFTLDDPVPTGGDDPVNNMPTEDKEEVDEPRQENTEEEQQDAEELRTGQDSQSIQAETGDDPDVAEDSQEERSVDDSGGYVEEAVQQSEHRASDSGGDTSSGMAVAGDSLTEEQQQRLVNFDDKSNSVDWTEAKRKWKEVNPDTTLKEIKHDYIHGKIDTIPWEKEAKEEIAKRYIVKKDNEQTRKEIKKESYQQNAEQSENTIWKKMVNRDQD